MVRTLRSPTPGPGSSFIAGTVAAGLLPFVQDRQPGPGGSADRLAMGCGFRWRFGKDAGRLPVGAPADHDPRQSELYRLGSQNKAKIDAALGWKGPGALAISGKIQFPTDDNWLNQDQSATRTRSYTSQS